MSKLQKIWLMIALGCFVVGILILIVAAAWIRFDFTRLNRQKMAEKTYQIEQSFRQIDISSINGDVTVLPAENNECSVICREEPHFSYSVEVQNDTLKIVHKDERPWYMHFGFFFFQKDPDLQVFLPKQDYEALKVLSVSGDISVSDALTFQSATIKSTSGDCVFSATAQQEFSAQTVSGDIRATHLGGSVKIGTTSGDIELFELKAAAMEIKTVSGEVKLEKATAESMTLGTVSGDIELGSCDAGRINITTVSGNVTGRLLSKKQFITKTTSGEVRVPDSVSETQQCEVKTTSGDIYFEIEEHF